MKHSNLWTGHAGMIALALVTGVSAIFLTSLRADDSKVLQVDQSAGQRTFATPQEAIEALRTATEAGDQAALTAIFGPDFKSLATGDPVQDQHNEQRFARDLAQSCQQVSNQDNSITIEVGTNQWPMPIPLVNVNGQWQFDTAAGKEEIIDRHVGKDELHAIGVCRVYVLAQKQHAAADKKGCYAMSFYSSEGKHDGLYWPASLNSGASLFGPRVAESQTGYHVNEDLRPQPFHGYYFKILTCQGADALGGKKDYIHHGKMTGGFALVAYPEHWDESGVMTFIVGPEGKVYQKNLGPETHRLVRKIKAYNPDETWTVVQDDGVTNAVAEQ